MKYFKSILKTKYRVEELEKEREEIQEARMTNLDKVIQLIKEVEAEIDCNESKEKLHWSVNKLQEGKLYDYDMDLEENDKPDFIKMLLGSTFQMEEQKVYSSNFNERRSKKVNTNVHFNRGELVNDQEVRKQKKSNTSTPLGVSPIIKQKTQTANLDSNDFNIFKNLNRNFSANQENINKEVIEKLIKFSKDEQIEQKPKKKLIIDRKKHFCSSISFDSEYNKLKEDFIYVDVDLKNYKESSLMNIRNFDFNIFKFIDEMKREVAFQLIFLYIIDKDATELSRIFNHKKLKAYLNDIYKGYSRDVAYHNDIHAIDLTQTLFSWMINSDFSDKIHLDSLDMFSFYLAALVHDFKHPGTNNIYQINFMTDIALTYNDISVLENYHIAESFKLLLKPKNNFVEILDNTQFRHLRKRMIDTVLATDMSHHSKTLSNVKTKLEFKNVNQGNYTENLVDTSNTRRMVEDQQELLSFIIHLGDLSHNTKAFEISHKWTMLLHEEFFKQGDQEKKNKKPVSFLCDRFTTHIEKGQIGFLKGLIWPSYEILVNIIPEISYTLENITFNLNSWQEKVENKTDEQKE